MREDLQGLVVVVPLTQLLVSHLLLFVGLTNPFAWLQSKHTNNSETDRHRTLMIVAKDV